MNSNHHQKSIEKIESDKAIQKKRSKMVLVNKNI